MEFLIYIALIALALYLLYLIVVYVILPGLGIFLAACLVTLGLVAAYGMLAGLATATRNFFQELLEGHRAVPPSDKLPKLKFYEPQPSYLIYAYDRGWRIINYVWNHVFERTREDSDKWFDRAKDWAEKADMVENGFAKVWLYSVTIGMWLAGISYYLSAFLFVGLFTLLQFIFLVSWVVISSVAMAILLIFTQLYSLYFRIFFRCPHCHYQMKIPVFVCPVCATEHSRLWPSIYGVFFHQCNVCNTKLPTLDLIDSKPKRIGLVQKCPNCGRPFNKDVGRLTNIHIPVVGGPSAGKSNYIVMATRDFIEGYAKPHGYKVVFPDKQHERTYQSNIDMLNSGKELEKTPDIVPQAYNLAVKYPGIGRVGKIIYIYDPAGEAYAQQDPVTQQKYYDYVHGIIFIIDPFSIEVCYKQYKPQISIYQNALRPSSLRVMDVYEHMLDVLELKVGLKRGVKFPHPIAVVVTKTDAFDLEQKIGATAIQRLKLEHPGVCSEEDMISIMVEQFLKQNGLGNLLRNLKAQFKNIKFFSCSALGRMPGTGNGQPYYPLRTVSPFLWLLDQVGVVNRTHERVKSIDEEHQRLMRKQPSFFDQVEFYLWESLRPYQ
jgi:hypothetical protein